MVKIVSDQEKNMDEIKRIIDSFDEQGKTFWHKRNIIKVFEVNGDAWNVKSFQVPHLINRIAYRYFRKSKARRSYEHAKILIEKGMLTPTPVGYAEFFDLIGLGRSYYVSENLKYDFTFNALYEKNFPDRENILNQFTEFTFQLHEKGIHHFDHSRGNTLILKRDDGNYDFYLIDLNRMTFEEMDYEKRINNFDRLGLTPDMIAIISRKYAELMHADPLVVRQQMTEACERFDSRRARKKKWKKRFGSDLSS